MKEYQILEENEIYSLENSVIRYLEKGYSLVGGPFINQYEEYSGGRYSSDSHTKKTIRKFCQAVYKKFDGTEEDY